MHSSKRKPEIRSAWRTLWLRAAAVAIGIQFLVPAGYMPGAFANGTPFVLCHMVTGAHVPQGHDADAEADAAHAGHAAHTAAAHDAAGHAAAATHTAPDGNAAGTGHEDHSDADAWENCPLGALSTTAALPATVTVIPAIPVNDHITTRLPERRGTVTPINLRARAPPVSQLRTFA